MPGTALMKHIPLQSFLAALCLLSGAANAALVLTVDSSTKEYYFEGSATGAPSGMMEMSLVSWDNEQAYGMNNDYSPNLLTGDMLVILGIEAPGPAFFVHAPGNINGGFNFSGEFSSVTIVANPEARGSYASWNPAVIATFEAKAQSGEIIPSGSDANFNIQLSAVPEPSSALLGMLGVCGLLLRRRR